MRQLSLAKGNPTLGEIVRGKLDCYSISPQYADIVLAHFAGNMRDNFMPIFKFYLELSVGKGLDDGSFHFNTFFFGHFFAWNLRCAECNEESSRIQTEADTKITRCLH